MSAEGFSSSGLKKSSISLTVFESSGLLYKDARFIKAGTVVKIVDLDKKKLYCLFVKAIKARGVSGT